MSFVERCVCQGNGTCHLPIYFIYPSFASLKCLACHPPPGTIPPLSYTQSLHTYPAIPCKVFSSWNSKIIRIISAKESGDYFLKNDENKRRKSHSPKKSCKQGVWIKDQIPLFQVWVHFPPSFDTPQDQNLVKFQSFMDYHSARQYR